MAESIYLSNTKVQEVLKRYSLDTASVETALTPEQLDQLIAECDAEIESALAIRFEVPLCGKGGSYDSAPTFVKNKVELMFKAMVRVILGRDFGCNVEFGANRDLISMNQKQFKNYVNSFLNLKVEYDLKYANTAGNSAEPVQGMYLSRGNNDFEAY